MIEIILLLAAVPVLWAGVVMLVGALAQWCSGGTSHETEDKK